ncbi:hypothetical protein M408DRAFT_145021 [Serendipita vermifera MAFF 305830]|uniref:Uncharacterized protein n=1 Tax=Serendipita vermifera MAFF 305830 TaxID=933852 RepID=A0A0C3B9W7_SERVB|nr:hypothetical protein M408DRAFT_145021 [Serendipita vermifera MAFF 305830]
MHNECIQSLVEPAPLVPSDLDVATQRNLDVLKGSLPVSSLPTTLYTSYEGEELTDDEEGREISEQSVVAGSTRLTKALNHSREEKALKPSIQAISREKSHNVEIQSTRQETADQQPGKEEFTGALQLCLFSAHNDSVVDPPRPESTIVRSQGTLRSILLSACTSNLRNLDASGTSDSTLSLSRTSSSITTSPSKRRVRFNSYVARGTFDKITSSVEINDYGWERYARNSTYMEDHGLISESGSGLIGDIEHIPPAMLFPPPEENEKGCLVVFSPPFKTLELCEDDLVVCSRHPDGIKGLRVQKRSSSMKLTVSFCGTPAPKPKYDFVSREEADELYERRDGDMFGDDAGANGAFNSGEIFMRGRRARRGRSAAATAGDMTLGDVGFLPLGVTKGEDVGSRADDIKEWLDVHILEENEADITKLKRNKVADGQAAEGMGGCPKVRNLDRV